MDAQGLTRKQSRAVDRDAIERLGIAGIVLMENAGRGCVDVMEQVGIAGPIAVLCGRGNNGGDGLVIARHLIVRGHTVTVSLLTPPEQLTGDARTNYEILSKLKDIRSVDGFDALRDETFDWYVDAILGTGAIGEPRSPFAETIRWLNNQTGKKLAVDLPSGLDCDTGEPSVATVRADHTCTFVAPKAGFPNPAAAQFLGKVDVLDIGVPRP